MLESMEADLPVLLVLVVLLATCIFLGKWSEAADRKARINLLAQLAAEEALRVEDASPVIVMPTAHSCAKCFAPATARCSNCKSVRYCSGKCQIVHWRLGHKEECQQLAISQNLSLNVDSVQLRPSMENGKHILGSVIDEPLYSDFVSDASSNMSCETASEKKFSDSDERVLSKLRKGIFRSNDAATSAFEETVVSGADTAPICGSTLLTELSSKDVPLNNKVGVSSSSEALYLNSLSDNASVRGSVTYKRPPYTLESTVPLSRKSAEKMLKDHCYRGIERNNYMDDESKASASYVSTSVPLQNWNGDSTGGPKSSGSRKSSKGHKWNLAGLIYDCSKNKMLFPYEDLVNFFQCELWGISPRGLLNCGNRLLVMSMQSICLEDVGGEKAVNPRLQETTLVHQIFGGSLESKVKCLKCHVESERYENIMDLTLEIHGWVKSLEDALTHFTAPEDLDGENMYRCGRCAAYVKARKQLRVHEVPNILTIVLKRFQTGKYGKLNKCVTFPDMLDMIPYVTGTADSPPLYVLYGVVVHVDTLNASFYGHYVSYVKDLQGTWFRIDDSKVRVVSLSDVMSEGAYMLFYTRSFPRPPRAYIEKASLHAASKAQKASSGQQKQTGPRGERHIDSVSMDNRLAHLRTFR